MTDKKTILVVEDEPNIAEVVSLYLERADFKVQVAADGDLALQILEKKIPDLIILDIMLPEVDGFAITRWLRGFFGQDARLRYLSSVRVVGVDLSMYTGQIPLCSARSSFDWPVSCSQQASARFITAISSAMARVCSLANRSGRT